MKQSILGYKNTSPDKNENSLYIKGNAITMQGVDKPLTLIPIINGKPDHSKRRIAKPGDADIIFEDNVTGVIELPYAQSQWGYVGGNNPYGGNSGAFAGINPVPAVDNSMEGYNYSPQQPYGLGIAPVPNFNPPSYSEELTPVSLKQQGVMLPDSQTQLDNNLRQQQEALNIRNQQTKGQPFVGSINPYGSWNASNTASYLGASIQDGNTLGIIGSAGKLALSLGRDAFAGAAAMKRYNEGQADYLEEDAKQRQRQGESYMQKGGEVTAKRPGLLLTGNFLEGNDEHPNPNVEIEAKEYVQTPDGNTMKIVGDRHSEGGELLNLPEGTKVVSDYLKIGGKNATYFKKNYGINVVAGSTYATVLDKYKKKIGLTKLLEEEAKVLDKVVEQEDVEMDSTRDINLQVLSKRANEIQPEKAPLEEDFNAFTNLVFQKQEENKDVENTDFQKQEGGEVNQNQEMLMQAISQYAEMNGQSPEEIINQIQSMPEEQQQQAIAQIVQTVQGGEQPQQGANIEQLITQYAQIVGQDPNAIIEQMQQMSEEEVSQVIQEMAQAVQGTEEQPVVESEITPDPNSAPPEEMKKGGEVPKYQGSVDKSGIVPEVRNAELSKNYTSFPFASTNDKGVLDWNLQKLNPATGTYDSFNPSERIGNYLNYIPVGAENYFEKKSDGSYGLMKGKSYADFQKGYNTIVNNTDAFLRTQTEGMTDAEKQTYLSNLDKYKNDIIFTTDKEEDYKGKTARGLDGKFGQFTSTRSGYKRKVVTPEQQKKLNDIGVYNLSQLLKNEKAQEIVGKELTDKLRKENTDFKGIDYTLDKISDGNKTTQETTEKTDASSDLTAPNFRNRVSSPNLPIQTPDQSNLPPNYLATSMRQVGSTQADRVFLSPEENLKELARQAGTASNQIISNNPYAAGAGLSALQANQNNAINQAIAQTTIANQQDERNVNNINEERVMKRDQVNLGLADKYEREAITGLDNYYSSWINYIDNRNRQNLSNYNLQAQVNSANAVNPNFQIGSMGEIYQTDEPFIINLGNNRQGLYDPKTKTVVRERKVSPDGRTTTTTTETPKKKKGGWITTDLSELLKN